MNRSVWRVGRRRRGDGFHGLAEAHVEHAVRFVEDEKLEARKVDAAPFQVVDQPARRGDDDVHGLRQEPLLFEIGHAAEDDAAPDAHELAVGAHRVGHLVGQFARRREHEDAGTLGSARCRRRHAQALERRQHEGRGLARAGLGRGDQVLPGQGQGDRLLLDRRRRGVAAQVNCFEDRCCELQV